MKSTSQADPVQYRPITPIKQIIPSKTNSHQANLMNPMNPIHSAQLIKARQSSPIESNRNPIEKIKSSQTIQSVQIIVRHRIAPMNRITSITRTNQSIQPLARYHCFIRQTNYSIMQWRKTTKSKQTINQCNQLKTKSSQVQSKQIK